MTKTGSSSGVFDRYKDLDQVPKLTDPENASRALPSDVEFALVGFFTLLKEPTSPFKAADRTRTDDDTFRGYLATTASKIQIYRDGRVAWEAKTQELSAEYFTFRAGSDSLVLTGHGSQVVMEEALPIRFGNKPSFESRASGGAGGYRPLLDRIKAAGGQVKPKSDWPTFVLIVAGSILVVLFGLWTIFHS